MAWTSPRSLAAALLALTMAAPAVAQSRRGGEGGACARVSRPGLLAESPPGRIVFDDGAERVALAPACGGGSLAERVRAGAGRRFILLVDDLRARQGSATVFTLRLAEPGDDRFSGEDAVLGTLNFFAARPLNAPGAQRRMSYDVTRSVRALAEAGRLDHGLVLMLAPSEPPTPGAELSVGRIQLVAQ